MSYEKAESHTAVRRRPRTKLYKVGNARQALADFKQGHETTCYTFGQFSLIDAVAAILERTGPADVAICSWTVGAADMQRMIAIEHAGQLRSIRWVVDQGFESRQPEYCRQMRAHYGDAKIRTIRAHAKFILIGTEDWQIVIRTSMNLNQNTRFEHLDVADDPEFYQWHKGIVDGIFERERPGDFHSKGSLDITGAEATRPFSICQMGIAETGHVNLGANP